MEEEIQPSAIREDEKKKLQIPKYYIWNRIIFGILVTALCLGAYFYTQHFQGDVQSKLKIVCLVGAIVISAFAFVPVRAGKILAGLMFLVVPPVAFGALESMTHDVFAMDRSPIILNLIVFYAMYLLLSAVLGNVRRGGMVTTIFVTIVSLFNYFAVLCRDTPVLPWDIKSAKTAMSVSSGYILSLEWKQCLCLLALFLTLVLMSYANLKIQKWIPRIACIVIGAGVILTMNSLTHRSDFAKKFMADGSLFTQVFTYRDNGFAISFMQNLQYMKIDKPDGYSVSKCEQILENAKQVYLENHPDYGKSDEVQPDIVMIMDEAFTDMAYLYPITTTDYVSGEQVDYMPTVHALLEDDNVISGTMRVSVVGGNTANTEFEALTGGSMAFLPNGSVAFQQYINSGLPSMATVLKEQGYQTIGLHPYRASGWNRDTVYPKLGIDTTYFKPDFKFSVLYRTYVSDASAFQKITEVQKDNRAASDTPNFIFEVTMQNHGGYSTLSDNAPLLLHVDELTDYPATDNYISLVKRTDDALKALLNYYENVDVPTVVCFFGDHQPNDFVSNPVWNLAGKKAWNERTLENRQDRYKVPFLIWSNFDMNAKQYKYDCISSNYLSPLVLSAAGVKMSPFEMFLANMMEEYPSINAFAYADSDNNLYSVDGELPETIKEYQMLQYYFLFDAKHRSEEGFAAVQ